MLDLPHRPTENFPYAVEEAVDRGSMGIVYRAHEPELKRVVALKFLDPRLLEEDADQADVMRRRFLQEARAAAALNHPNVVTIYRIGEVSGTPYIAMEWLSGQSLETVIDRGEILPQEQVVQIGCDVLAGLEAAHRAGVIHRDVKPSNVMLLEDGRVKVTDFGIAQVQDSELVKTQAGMVLGTPLYLAPEQLQGSKIDHRADLYATAMMLYVLLLGRHPFHGQSVATLINSILRVAPPLLHLESMDVNPTTAAVVHRSLEKPADRRHGSAAEMAQHLRASVDAAGGVPLAAHGTAATSHVQGPVQTVFELPEGPRDCVAAVVDEWPAQRLGSQPLTQLLDRLSETPLHAPPFSGAVRFDDITLLFDSGLLVGAYRGSVSWSGDRVLEEMPQAAEVTLHPVPPELPTRVMSRLALLATGTSRKLHADLDSGFVNLAALSNELHDIQFNGMILMRRDSGRGYMLMVDGATVLQLFTAGWEKTPAQHSWEDAPVQQPWETWISELKVRADVEACTTRPLFESYRIHLAGTELGLEPQDAVDSGSVRGTSGALGRMFGTGGSSGIVTPIRFRIAPAVPLTSDIPVALHEDPMDGFLQWMTTGLIPYLSERKRAGEWKYLVSWIALIRKARLHFDLPRPDSRESDTFDLVTFDGESKVLHLAHRTARGDLEDLDRFVTRVIAAKTARTKTGDVGAACLIAPEFQREALDAYAGVPRADAPWELNRNEGHTGYESFVRLGARRGFHLLLVQERDGRFEPILPDTAQTR
jgi:serine/threonine protein kinase